MRLIHNNKTLLICVFTLALIARVIALFLVEPISNPRTWEYEEIANNILQGKGLYWTFYQTPYRATYIVLYPLICSGVYFLTNHSFLALKILQIFISLGMCLVIYRIALKVFNRRVAILALFLVGLHPGLVFYSVRLHSLTLDAFLFTLSVFLLIKILENRKIYRSAVLFAIVFGLAMLSRTTIAVFLPLVLLIIFLRFKKQKSLYYRIIPLIVAIVTLSLVPLWVRNYIVFKKIVLSPTESGLTFWLAYNPQATGTNKTLKGEFIFDVAPEEFRRDVLKMDEFGQKEYFYREGWRFIKNYPLKALSLTFKKIKYFWWFTPTQGWEYPRAYLSIYRFYWISILVLFILGLYQKIKPKMLSSADGYNITAVVGFLIAITLAHALFNLDGRHRWIIEGFVLIFAANGINYIFSSFSDKKGEVER